MTVPTLATIDAWNDTWALIRGLWPKWEPTDEQHDLWEDSLRPLSQERARRAVKATATARWREPTIDDIIEKYRGANAKSAQHQYTGPPYTMAEANAEVADMRRELMDLDGDSLAAAVKGARANLEMLGKRYNNFDATDASTMPHGLVGFVWAANQEATT